MGEKSTFLGRATVRPRAPECNYKRRRGLNGISVLSKSRCGRSLSNDKFVIWRMSAYWSIDAQPSVKQRTVVRA
jgi:hypothetical protein